jgi:signal peptidase I
MTAGTSPSRTRAWRRTALYAAGTGSMLVISMACSLVLWIALPWAFLGWSPTLVTSGSMRPLVSPGDVVMIRPARPADLAVNTVVLYDRPDTGRILHRIVELRRDGTVQTQGDANAVPDSEFVHRSDVRGVAVLAVPWIGRPSLWLYQRRIPVLVAAVVALLVALRLAPRSFDPAFDPWGGANRVNPAEVLLGRRAPSGAGSRSGSGLLPEAMRGVVLGRLAAQTRAAERRTAVLLEGLS